MTDYTALYLPCSDNNPTRAGFDSEESAWAWIRENHYCKTCQIEAIVGHRISNEHGCACNCYWDVVLSSTCQPDDYLPFSETADGKLLAQIRPDGKMPRCRGGKHAIDPVKQAEQSKLIDEIFGA